ncbi:MAG TPA: OmpA family protein [Chitinophagales bacterium]|nr:OmpA family protein [Chitinophagales bacterium]
MPFLLTACCLLFLSSMATAQNDDYGWRLGAGIGYMAYYGDLTDNDVGKAFKNHYQWNANRDLAFSLSLERRLTSGISLQLSGNRGYITANDRNRAFTDPLFNRALNFRTEINDGNLSFVFKTDNDRILGDKAFIAPYFLLGAGITNFRVFADLQDGDGSFYDYTLPLLSDGTYETEITNIGTEKIANYATLVPHVNAGLGLRFRFWGTFSLHFQTDLRYALSDYLDDVGSPNFRTSFSNEVQAFAGKPNPQYTGNRGKTDKLNDIYAISTVSLRINFGRKKETFLPPVFYAQQVQNTGNQLVQLVANEVKVGTETIVVYDTIKVIEKGYTAKYDSAGIGQTKALVDSLRQVQLSNQQMAAQLLAAQQAFTQMQQELSSKPDESDAQMLAKQNALLSQMDSLQKSVTNLYIVSANTSDKSGKPDSLTTDAAYTAQFKMLRAELDRLRAEQLAANKPSLYPMQTTAAPITTTAPAAGLAPVMPVVANTQQTPPANANAYQSLKTDMEALKTQISLLTNAVNAQTQMLAKQPQTISMPPVIVQQPTAAAIPNQQFETALQNINNQLFLLSNRIGLLEQRPPTVASSTAPASVQPSVVVNQPDPSGTQALLSMVEDLRRQIQLLNAKVGELERRPDVAPPSINVEPPATPAPAGLPAPPPVNTIPTNTKPPLSPGYLAEVDKLGSVSIFFDVNSTVITDVELKKVERVAEVIRKYPEARITINGYADSTGNADYNRKLSEKRAQAVRDRLIQGFRLNPQQVILNAFGNTDALPGANSFDRRVDLQWVK